MITFRGQFIEPVIIQRKGIDNKFHDYRASFVELKPHSYNDLISLNLLNCRWNNCETFINDIAKQFNYYSYNPNKTRKHHFFAITKQQDSFEKINVKEVLGFVQTKNKGKDFLEIEFLQVNPNTKYNAEERNYTQVGKKILDIIKEIFNKKNLELKVENEAIPFYERNGFVLICSKNNKMRFRR